MSRLYTSFGIALGLYFLMLFSIVATNVVTGPAPVRPGTEQTKTFR
jgi:hypothetical protein